MVIGLLIALSIGWYAFSFYFSTTQLDLSQPTAASVNFDGPRAYNDVKTQVAFGPRIPESEGHAKVQAWMHEELESAGWQMEIQQSESMGHPIKM